MTATCPDAKSWQNLVHGTLPKTQQAELNAHLEACPACQQTLEGLVASQESWSGTAKELKQTPLDPTGKLGQVMARLKAHTTGEPGSGEPGRLSAGTETNAEGDAGPGTDLRFLQLSQHPGHLGRLKQYEILSILGKGGFGTVFKAQDEALDRVVAIKVLAPQLATNATARRRFTREAKAAAAVSHDHVVGIYAVDEADGIPYIAMQLVHGKTLQERLDQSGPLELKAILRIGMQVAEGLAAAHKQGLVHRDIKPANILLENGVERVKITDFGLARAIDDASLTQSGVIAGTPMFMAPEQAAGEAVDHRADLFSLGSVLYTMCTGHPPFRASGTMGVLKRVIDDEPRPIREINPDMPEWLCAIIVKLQAKKAADRFQSAKEVAELLEQHLAHVQQPSLIPQPTALLGPTSVPVPALPKLVVTPDMVVRFATRVVLFAVFFHTAVVFLHWQGDELGTYWPHDLGLGLLTYLPCGLLLYKRWQNPKETSVGQLTLSLLTMLPLSMVILTGSDCLIRYGRPWILAMIFGLSIIIEATKLFVPSLRAKSNPFTRPVMLLVFPVIVLALLHQTEHVDDYLVPTFVVGLVVSAYLLHLNRDQVPNQLAQPASFEPAPADGPKAITASRFRRGRRWAAGIGLTLLALWLIYWFGPATQRYLEDVGVVSLSSEDPEPELVLITQNGEMVTQVDLKTSPSIKLAPGAYVLIPYCRQEQKVQHWDVIKFDQFRGETRRQSGHTFNLDLKRGQHVSLQPRVRPLPPPPPDKGIWVQLFNGKDLTGWKTHPDQPGDWKVEDAHQEGRLKASGPASHLFSERGDYENFHLRVEAEVSDLGLGGFGMYYRSGFGLAAKDGESQRPTGYVAGFSGDDRMQMKQFRELFKPSEWFTLEVIADGNRRIEKYNGKIILDVEDLEPKFRKGHLVLRQLNDNVTTLFRKIEIKELPPN